MSGFNPNDYETVHDRIPLFYKAHPEGSIVTEFASDPHDKEFARFKAFGYRTPDDPHPFTGYACEHKGSGGPVNGKWHEENAETSAIGRMLANAGFAGSKRPSREEMGKAEREGQGGGKPRPATTSPPQDRRRAAPASLPAQDVRNQVQNWTPGGLEREGECHACGTVGDPSRLKEHDTHGLLCPGCMEDAVRGEDPRESFDSGPTPDYAEGAEAPPTTPPPTPAKPARTGGPAPGEWVLPFGKHKGKKLKSAPKDYLDWCLENMGDKLKDEARAKIRAYLEATKGD